MAAPAPFCKWCGKKATVPHHPTRDHYGKPEYINLYLSGCVPLCKRCHNALHKGLKLCPICKERYCKPEHDCCYGCLPDERKEAIRAKKDKWKRIRRQLQREASARARSWRVKHVKKIPASNHQRKDPQRDRGIPQALARGTGVQYRGINLPCGKGVAPHNVNPPQDRAAPGSMHRAQADRAKVCRAPQSV